MKLQSGTFRRLYKLQRRAPACTRRVMTLAEWANVAAFVACDRASGLTGTTVNMTMGGVDD